MEGLEKILTRIALGLRQRPAYLLWLGIVLIVLTGSGTTALLKSGTDSATPFLVMAVIALIGTVVIVLKLEAVGSPGVGDSELSTVLTEVHENLQKAMLTAHPDFRSFILGESQKFKASTSQWANSTIKVRQREYNRMLVSVYRGAEKEVFATSTVDFRVNWTANLGAEILKAHLHSKASAIRRVFVFDSLAEVTPDDLKVMSRQLETGRIEIFFYGKKEDVNFDWPDEISPSFAFVDDGKVLAVTAPINQTNAQDTEGDFYFQDRGKREAYKNAIENILRGAIPWADYENGARSPAEVKTPLDGQGRRTVADSKAASSPSGA